MGTKPRQKPHYLAAKLLKIRRSFRLTQPQFANLLNVGIKDARVCEYENGVREPNLLVLLRYARISGVSVEALIDDELKPSQMVIAEHYLDSI